MRVRSPLFRKYVLVFVAVIGGMLIARGLIELYISYRDNKASLVRLQREKAAAAAVRIEHFIREIEGQIGWASHPSFMPSAQVAEQRRFDFLWLLRQVPSITEISYLDSTGKEQLRVSRLARDEVGSQKDYSAEPKFRQAMSGRTYFGPVYFRKESEPYMTLATRWQASGAGVTVAELNLKLDLRPEPLYTQEEADAWLAEAAGARALVGGQVDDLELHEVPADAARVPGWRAVGRWHRGVPAHHPAGAPRPGPCAAAGRPLAVHGCHGQCLHRRSGHETATWRRVGIPVGSRCR
jgi:hypothetical protein